MVRHSEQMKASLDPAFTATSSLRQIDGNVAEHSVHSENTILVFRT